MLKVIGNKSIAQFFLYFYTSLKTFCSCQCRHPAQEGGADGSRNGGGAQGQRACAPTLAFVMIGKTALPVKAWKAEYAKLTAERETLNRRYLALKGEVKEAEQIRRSVYNILRQEQREQQPRRAQDMER